MNRRYVIHKHELFRIPRRVAGDAICCGVLDTRYVNHAEVFVSQCFFLQIS